MKTKLLLLSFFCVNYSFSQIISDKEKDKTTKNYSATNSKELMNNLILKESVINLILAEINKTTVDSTKTQLLEEKAKIKQEIKERKTIDATRTISKNGLPEFLFTNAVSFDFGSTTKSSTSYFGHINYFFNINKEEENSKYYINTGLIKVNYYSSEINTGSFYQYDNVLENVLGSTQPGENYIKQFNKYDFDVKLNSYSAYVQLLRKISKNYNNLFFHLHTELLVTNINTTLKVTNVDKKTVTIPLNNIIPITNYLETEKSTSSQNIGAFLGAGLTAKFSFLKNADDNTKINYFLQGTVGYSNSKLNPKLYQKSKNELPDFENSKDGAPFFIIHSYFENNITGANIILGSQIRGNFTNSPLYSFYVGLNIDLNTLTEILK